VGFREKKKLQDSPGPTSFGKQAICDPNSSQGKDTIYIFPDQTTRKLLSKNLLSQQKEEFEKGFVKHDIKFRYYEAGPFYK